ncbi:hypothetical protein [Yoonia sp.]|uniref:hypothetical protein n=1 Tax=Yoonia sp. TaxID=2212373 RepID=UPI003F6CCF10
MKLIPVMMVGAAITAVAGSLAAQDNDRDRSRGQLQKCGNLSVSDCAELFWVRERLRDCTAIAPEDCAVLMRARDTLEACADDRTHDRSRDCNPLTN